MMLGKGNIPINGTIGSGQILVRKTFDKSKISVIPSGKTVYKLSHSNYKTPFIILFDEVGESSWTAPEDVEEIEYLVCAGGGSSIPSSFFTKEVPSGGGGAGGVAIGEMKVVSGTLYTVTVGNGGSASNGSNSSILKTSDSNIGITAFGGGYGGRGGSGNNGGSGGGGGNAGSGGLGTSGQGYAGGNGYTQTGPGYNAAGGGGGAGSVGANAHNTGPGVGGSGIFSELSGTSELYGNGGNGADQYSRGSSGTGWGFGGGGNTYNDETVIPGGQGRVIIKYWR